MHIRTTIAHASDRPPLAALPTLLILQHARANLYPINAIATSCGVEAEPALSLSNGSRSATFRAMRVTNLNNLAHRK